MGKKSAAGSGSIRKITIEKNGKTYTYYQARYTAGTNPGTGKQEQHSITCKTQKEAAQKLRAATKAIDDNAWAAPSDLTVGAWLDFWADTFLTKQKPSTVAKYKSDINNHIKPGIGAVKLKNLTTETVQRFYKNLKLSDKSKRNIHGTLHKALDKARQLGKIAFNPTDDCELKRPDPHEITPLAPDELVRYIDAARNDDLGSLLIFLAFTGMRRNELLGLSWSAVNFRTGAVTVRQQLHLIKGGWEITPTKSSNTRTIYPAQIAMDALKEERKRQAGWATEFVEVFDNPANLCFTREDGHYIPPDTLRKHHNHVLEAAGLEHHRLHDLRDTFAVTSLQAGDDIKTVQQNLGHADAAFTLNVYLTSLEAMKKKSAGNMQAFFNDAEKLQKQPDSKGKKTG